MTATRRIAVIVGSTRPKRICRQIAEWVMAVARPERGLAYELVDLAEIALPFLDEPLMAASGRYEHEHTKRWSRLVASYDGFVFVMPQYNCGYSAVLKNALDFLYAEWHDKAAAVVTYGSHGGGKGAAQLAHVLQSLGMRATKTNPKFDTPPNDPDHDVAALDLASLQPFAPDVRTMSRELESLVNEPVSAPDGDWESRMLALWLTVDERPESAFLAAIGDLASELPADSAVGAFERAAAFDSTGRPDLAIPLYEAALHRGIEGERRRRAVIQLASSVRNLGDSPRAVAMLGTELDGETDALTGAVRAFLALALADVGRERDAVVVALEALAEYLPRYNRSVARYARALVVDDVSD